MGAEWQCLAVKFGSAGILPADAYILPHPSEAGEGVGGWGQMNDERFVAALLASTCEAEREVLFAALLDALAADEVEPFAQQVKSAWFDRYLNADLEKAARLADGIEQLGHAAHHPAVVALGLLARGDATRQGGHALDAMTLHQRAGEGFLHAGDRIGWARARGGWLVAATHAGRVTEADLAAMTEARAVLAEAGQKYRVAVLDHNFALAHQYLGHYQLALQVFENILQAIETETSIPYATLRASSLLNKANTLLYLGELLQARQCYQSVQTLAKEISSIGIQAIAEMYISVIEQLRWHCREAMEASQSAINGLNAAKLPISMALALLYHTNILLLLNRSEEALTTAQEAATILRTYQFPADLIMALLRVAQAQKQLHLDDLAVVSLLEGKTIAQNAGYIEIEVLIAVEHCATLLAQQKVEEAREAAFDILQSQRYQVTELNRGMALLIATEATLGLGKTVEAQSMARATIKRGKQLEAPEILYRGHLVLARAARQQQRASEALRHYDSTFGYLQAQAQELVLDQRAQFLEDKDSIYLEAIEISLQAGNVKKALSYLEESRAHSSRFGNQPAQGQAQGAMLATLRKRHRYISESLFTLQADSPAALGAKQELKRLTHQIRDILEAQRITEKMPLPEKDLLQAIPHDLTVLAYAVLERDIVIFVLRQGRVLAERVTEGAQVLRKCERAIRLNIDTLTARLAGADSERAAAEITQWSRPLQFTLRRLWDVLIQPVAHLLPASGAPLAIIPHGVLHTLPLLALFDGQQYLAERWLVQLLPSCRALTRADETIPASTAQTLLSLGYSHEGSLPNAHAEAQHIADLMGGEAWLGSAAMGENLLQHARNCAYLHIAAHGAVRLDVPNASFVQLADGPFHPTDVLELDLRGCRLVTLSACETGLGRMSGGDEQIGLARAFGLAGAESVLATLWRVDDASTFAFMEAFYQRIALGATPVAALNAAQRMFINDPVNRRSHPYFWAGFQLTTHIPRFSSSVAETSSQAFRVNAQPEGVCFSSEGKLIF